MQEHAPERIEDAALIRTREGLTAEGLAKGLGHLRCAALLAKVTERRGIDLQLEFLVVDSSDSIAKPKGRKGRKKG